MKPALCSAKHQGRLVWVKQDVDGKYEFTENFKEAELFFHESEFMAAMSWAYHQPDTTHVRKDRGTVDLVNELGLLD